MEARLEHFVLLGAAEVFLLQLLLMIRLEEQVRDWDLQWSAVVPL